MKGNLTDLWKAWMEDAGPERSSDGLLTVGYLKDTLSSHLRTAGCAMPSRRSLEDALAAGLEDLPTKRVLKNDRRCFSFAHLLNMVWGPVIDYLDSAAEGEPVWTKQLAWNHSMLIQEMEGIIAACDEPNGDGHVGRVHQGGSCSSS